MGQVLAAIAFGLVGGMLSGMFGVGGGSIFVPALVLLYHLDQHAAQGASLAAIVITASVGAGAHLRQRTADLRFAAWLALPAALAAFLGASLATQLDGETLRRCFGVVVLGVGLHFIISTARRHGVSSSEGAEGEPGGA